MNAPQCLRCVKATLLLFVLLLLPSFGLATVPKNQTTPNVVAGNEIFADIVGEGKADAKGKLTPANTFGTGSVIDAGTLKNGNGFFCVLTADHVAETPLSGKKMAFNIGFGNNPLNHVSKVVAFAGGGPTGKEDIAVQIVDYGKAPDAFFNAIKANAFQLNTNFGKADFGKKTPDGPVGEQFTQAGYGLSGNFNNATGAYSSSIDDNNKRFQDNMLTKVTAGLNPAYSGGVYTYDAAIWNPLAPGTGWGKAGGSTFGGDSGSPYLVGDQQMTNASFNYAPTGDTTGNMQKGPFPIMTDFIMGVHTFGFDPSDTKPPDENFGVYLSADDDAWIEKECAALLVPEPSSLTLSALAAGGMFALAAVRRRLRVA
jgi:hypothetical protein